MSQPGRGTRNELDGIDNFDSPLAIQYRIDPKYNEASTFRATGFEREAESLCAEAG